MDRHDRYAEALGKWRKGSYPWREAGEFLDIMQEDIVLVGQMDLSDPVRRMVAVLDVDHERRCFLGALATNELSLAAADDVILAPEVTDLPYQVAVLTGMAGYMWFVQVDERLGAMSVDALEAALAGYTGAEDHMQHSLRGVPLQDAGRDLRWPALEAEVDCIQALTRDCAAKRHEDDIGLPFPDPSLLENALDGHHAQLLEILEEATRNGRTRGFSPSCVEQVAGRLDCQILRAYPTMFQPRGPITTSPPVRSQQDSLSGWYFALTTADALAGAGFAKMIGGSGPSGPTRSDSNGRRYELLYETVKWQTDD
ncbi:MAG: hypothetical protein OXF41_16475 [bacterium]|nr:hypothetical protein [bacterium]